MPHPTTRRKLSWIARTQCSGALASVLSSVVVAACSAREARTAFAGVNAASQWVWGRHAKRHTRPSWRYTAVGYLIHHASSLLWAGLFEGWSLRHPAGGPVQAAGRSIAVASAACLVDYTVTPQRFRPGFERHISRSSVAAVYAGFALGLFAGALLLERTARRG